MEKRIGSFAGSVEFHSTVAVLLDTSQYSDDGYKISILAKKKKKRESSIRLTTYDNKPIAQNLYSSSLLYLLQVKIYKQRREEKIFRVSS